MNNNQGRSLFKSYCYDTLVVLNDCFETSLLGIKRLINKVESYQKRDNLDVRAATIEVAGSLWELKESVMTMVPIKDLPSCKKLSDLSAEDIVAKAKNLVESDILKAGVGVTILGKKVGDTIIIVDVRNYYESQRKELCDEIKEKGVAPSGIEQYLLDKFNAEIGYCDVALYKAGLGGLKELKELVEIGQKYIEKYEREKQYAGMGMINKQISV